MSTTTPNAGYIKPDPDASVGTWDTEINATIDLLDAHDHSTGNGVRVPVAGLDIDADLPMAGFGIAGLKVVDLAAVLASEVTGYPTALFCNSADNELYWRTSGGSNVQLTSGASLNAALLGGFTGDYGTGGSEANFNSGTSIFNFLRAANHRGNIDSADHRLFEGTAGITNAVKLRSPNALAASYDWIYPTALPGVQTMLQLGSAGQVAASNALPANSSFTVSGTGLYKRPARTRPIHPACGDGTGSIPGNTNGAMVQCQLNEFWVVPLLMEEGERLTQVVARVKADGAADFMTMKVFRIDASGTGFPVHTQLGATQTSTATTNTQSLTVTGLTETVGTSQFTYEVEFFCTAAATNAVNVAAIFMTSDVP